MKRNKDTKNFWKNMVIIMKSKFEKILSWIFILTVLFMVSYAVLTLISTR